MDKLNRREFLGGLAAASAFTIVPRRVLGGRGYRAPSDMILLAQVGCGTQAQRQVNTGMVRHPGSAVRGGGRSESRQLELRGLEPQRQPGHDPALPRGAGVEPGRRHPRGPRGRQRDHGDLLPEAAAPERGHPGVRGLSRDAREGAGHPGHREHHARSPARQHQHLGAEEGQGRHRAQAGRPYGGRSAPHAGGGAREVGDHASARLQQLGGPSHPGGLDQRRASSVTSAKCTTGRIVRSGRRAGRSTTRPGRRCRPASTGSSGRARNRIGRITRTTRSRSTAGGTRTAPAALATWGSTACGSRTGS